ncbi:MAG: polysaccharide biosynthesis C-terminal domain-containing protein [Clostridia bacterium]|nr:polysaccharide biosynthesis C-terminal domain-containing protein [Clostridia bacterium]
MKVPTGNYLKRIFTISAPVAITSYIRSGLSTFKHLLIPGRLEKSGLTDSIALSSYGMIHGMAMPLILFPSLFITSFAGLLVPEFSRYYVKKDFKRIKQVSIYILTVSILLSTLLGIFLFVFADKLGVIFYDNVEIGKYIKIMSPLVLFIYVDTVVDSILKGLNAQVGIMLVNILDLFVTILIIFFVVPVLGVNGYLLSIFVSEILNFTISLWQLIYTIQKGLKQNTRAA